jgi:plasmid maintenance system killer protein
LAEAQKAWGTRCGLLVRKRLDEISAAANLRDLMALPQARCHALKGDREGEWSVDVEHPRRLLFEPADHPLPRLENGELDLLHITTVKVLGVEDTHG